MPEGLNMTYAQTTALRNPCSHPGDIFNKMFRSILPVGQQINGELDSLKITVLLTVNRTFPPNLFGDRPYWCAQVRYHYRNGPKTLTMKMGTWTPEAVAYAFKIAGQFLDGVGLDSETQAGRAMDCAYVRRPLTDKEVANLPGKSLIITR